MGISKSDGKSSGKCNGNAIALEKPLGAAVEWQEQRKLQCIHKSNDNGGSNGRSDVNGGGMTGAIVMGNAMDKQW